MLEAEKNYLPKVREQYEEFPYPERNPENEKNTFIVTYLSRMDAVNHFCFKGRQNFNNFRVLIAGGGTGDNLISWGEQLRDKENGEVVYLDMSTASTEIAKKRAEIRKLTNVKFINDSLLNLPKMDIGKFDFIDCSGVLHHLKDPDAGLKALKSVLKPNGAMSLMVYAPYGRTGVYMIQNLMRLVNGAEKNPRKQINNTKVILKSLPIYHWFNVAQKLWWGHGDHTNDAGIYDMFLHSQDRAYTIVEVHDWLAACGLKMSGEPGNGYLQEDYLPETYIKDEELLKKIKEYPLKIQQGIGEALANKITKHEFYAIPGDAKEAEAQVDDKDLVVCTGINKLMSFEDLAGIALQKKESFTLTFDKLPSAPKIYVPQGKYIASLLRYIDGKRTVGEILEAVKNSDRYKDAGVDEALLFQEFKELFKHLNRGYVAFLRDKSVEPFTPIRDIQTRVEDMYKK